MKIGFLGGSFDPPTVAHMHLAQNIADVHRLDLVILAPCSSKRYDKSLNVEDKHRLAMVNMIANDNSLFVVDTFEMNQPAEKVFSYFTMEHIKSLYPNDDVYFIMGADVLIDLAQGNWDYGRALVENNKFIAVSRSGKNLKGILDFYPFIQPYKSHFQLHQLPDDISISSTYIRSELNTGRNPRYLLPPGVYDYIKRCGLYR